MFFVLLGGGVVGVLAAFRWVWSNFMRPLTVDEARQALTDTFFDMCRKNSSVKKACFAIVPLRNRQDQGKCVPDSDNENSSLPSVSARFDSEDPVVEVATPGEDARFFSASVGKLVTSAIAISLDLNPDNEFTLDADARELLLNGVQRGTHDGLTDVLAALGSLWGGDGTDKDDPFLGFGGGNAVTIRSLLSHTARLPDYFSPSKENPGRSVTELIVAEPSSRWTPQRAIIHACENFGPLRSVPFTYSDTGYDVAGLCIEIATGESLVDLAARLVFAPAKMEHTYYHAIETERFQMDTVDPCVIEGVEINSLPAATIDWAGGGLVTTCDDLVKLLRWLDHDGGGAMMEVMGGQWTVDSLNSGIDYGISLWKIRPAGLSFALSGQPELLGASGSTGTFAYVVPDLNACIVGAFNDSTMMETHVQFLVQCLLVFKRIPSLQEARKQ